MLCRMFALHRDENRQKRRAPAIWRTMLNIDRGLVNLLGHLKVTGEIPADLRNQPLLMTPNHIGNFDPFVIMAACKRIGINPRFLLAGGILDAPVIGKALQASGHLRIDRAHATTAVGQFGEAVEALRSTNDPIVVYPEGRISHDVGLWPERGKTGAARLALGAGVPVIPISQWGAHEIVYWGTEVVNGPADVLPLLKSGLTAPVRRPTLRVHFGKPVDLSEVEPERPGAGVRAHAKIMQAITDGLVELRRDEPDVPRFTDPTRPTDSKSPWLR
jgi:1-acyl-sn-glycerol-3-phosphate acyltransferase